MTQLYYVDPEYWLEGYAEGDITVVSASAVMSISATTSAFGVRVITASFNYVDQNYWEPNYTYEGIAASSSISASCDRVILGAAEISASTLVAANGNRIQQSQALISASISTSATALAIYLGSASMPCTVTITGAGVRVRTASATSANSCIIAANGRFKWEPEADTSETWTPVPDTSETWTNVG
jgi:hypothetical protein